MCGEIVLYKIDIQDVDHIFNALSESRKLHIMKLFGAPFMRTARPLFMLEELELEYELIPINPRVGAAKNTKDYAEYMSGVNPYGKVPTLVDDDFVLNESAVIVNYLCDQYGKGNYIPKAGSKERAKYDALCYTLVIEIDAQSLYMHRKHIGLKHIYGEAPTAVDAAKTYFEKQFPIYTKVLESNQYMFGDSITGLDILCTHTFLWAKSLGWYKDDLSYVNNYLGRMCARDSFKRAYEKHVPNTYTSGMKYVERYNSRNKL